MQDMYKPTLHFGAKTKGLRRDWPPLPSFKPLDQVRIRANYGDPATIWTVLGISWVAHENNWRLFLRTDAGTQFTEERRVPFDENNIIKVT